MIPIRRIQVLGVVALLGSLGLMGLPTVSADAQQRTDASQGKRSPSADKSTKSVDVSGNMMPTEMRLRDGSIVAMGDYVGMWQGTMRTETGPHRVALEVAPRTIGDGLVASMTSSAQKPFSVLVDTISVANHQVTMGMSTAGTRFTGRMNDQQTEIRGRWEQEGKSIPLTLKRVIVQVRTEAHAERQSDRLAAMTDLQQPSSDLPAPAPPKARRQPWLLIGPAHRPVAYDWMPHLGNQTVSYGLDYW